MKYSRNILMVMISVFIAQGINVNRDIRDLELEDILNYMEAHRDIIEATQSQVSESMDRDVLEGLIESIGKLESSLRPVTHNETSFMEVGNGEDRFITIVGDGELERGPEVDLEFGEYCKSSNITLHRGKLNSLILCGDGRILERPKAMTRRKRSTDESEPNTDVKSQLEKYINNCHDKCIFSKSLKKAIGDCLKNHTKDCTTTFMYAYIMLTEPAHYQPSINHFFDNSPHRKILSVHNSLEPVPLPQNVLQTIPMDCNGKLALSYVDGNCASFMASEMNAIYKLFNNKVENDSSLYVVQTANQYKSCEPHDHIWKDAKVVISLTGEHDSVLYRVRAINEQGANVSLHCITTICNLCVKEIPVLLQGKCEMKHTISETGHIINLCNKEDYTIGYFIRLLHGGSRIDMGYNYRSRFLLMNLYTFAHEKIIGVNPKLTEDSEGPQIVKGTIQKGSCESLKAGNIDREWLQYYVKCGQSIYHHNEYLTESYRCNLKYEGYRLGWILKWVCYNWYFIRFFLIITISIFFMYILWFIGVYRYVAIFLCMITSPISYIMYKYWPCFARCTRCGLPWMPWHKCNEICLCGEEFNDKHKLSCEFYTTNNDCMNSNHSHIESQFQPVDIVIPDIGSMSYISHVRSQRRQVNRAQSKMQDIETGSTDKGRGEVKALKSMKLFQTFSSFRNPFTVFTVRFSLFLITYIVFCIVTPVAIAECIECTDKCRWNGKSYTEDCRGISDDCICTLITVCEGNKTSLLARSSMNDGVSERTTHKMNGCIKDELPYQVDYFFAAFLELQGCFKNISKSLKRRQRILLKTSTLLPTYAKLYVLERDSSNCVDIVTFLSRDFHLPHMAMEELGLILNTRLDFDQSKEISVKGLQYVEDRGLTSHDQKDFEKSVKPIQDVVEETKKEEIVRKNGELLQEFHNIINLLSYNGSIFGRDHSISIPQPPSFIQHVYTSQNTGSSTIVDMSMQAISGSASAFRPVHNGKEVPITFITSIPEVAGVYTLKYLYTTCKTSVIDTVRYDRCVGTCDSCYEALDKQVLDSTKLTKFHNFGMREKISFDNPNTWGCEGSGCWTINTGCLCAYCSNLPDPRECLDVYTATYHSSKALVCLSINEDYQCEHVMLGRPIERKGKVQILLQGSDEWSSFVKSEMIAIGRGTGKIMTGLINGLGESSGNFGSPQYSRNLTLLYKVPDVDAHYICNSGSDQEVIFNSCFKDTWSMLKDLKESAAFFLDSKKGQLYHVGKNIGTLRIILNIPVDKIEWKTTDLNLNVHSAICVGCYGCVNGVHCNIEIESTHSGMVYIYTQPCVVRVSTINILRGTKRYNVTMDCSKKPISSYLYIKDGNGKTITKKTMSMTLNEGNTPRTTERNATNHKYDITGQNDNTLSGIGDFLRKINPISAISNFFSSSFIHWILYILLAVILVICVVLLFYYVANAVLRRVTNKVVIGKQE